LWRKWMRRKNLKSEFGFVWRELATHHEATKDAKIRVAALQRGKRG